MDVVRWLKDLTREDLALAGGKGCNLGETIRAGLPVPNGFVLTTEAYRAFIAENGLERIIALGLTRAGCDGAQDHLVGNLSALDEATGEIRAAFAAGKMPAAARDRIAAAYAGLGEGPVAVRSSATAEDLPTASFAGQQETFLCQEGIDAVLEAIKRCWASLWTSRAVAYRAGRGLAPLDVSLAVVIQQMVPATAAGILFTANPVNGRRDQIVIDAAWGLGESVVSGQVNPDQWVVDGATGHVLTERLASKKVMTVRSGGGTATVPVPEDMRERPALDAEDIEALAGLGRRAAAHFGSPQDIEWAMAGERLYLVQSRPITSLFPLARSTTATREGLRVYVCHTLIQGISEPFTPMGLAVLEEVQRINGAINGAQIEPRGVPPVMAQAAGRLFIDVTDTLQHSLMGPKLLFILGRVEPGTASILRHLVDREPTLGFRKQGRPSAGMSFSQALGVMGEMFRAMAAPEKARQRAVARIEADLGALEEEARGLPDPVDGLGFALRTIARLRDLLLPLFAPLGVGMLGQEGAEALVRKWTGDEQALAPVARSLPHNPTTGMDLSLWRVSRVLKEEGVEPSPEHPAVQRFLRQFGHRAIREMDIGIPRWREDPGYIMEVLETYLRHGDEANAESHFREGEAAAEVAAARLVNSIRKRRGRLQAWFLRHLLRWMRSLSGLRESPKSYTIRLLATVREVLQRSGEGLAAAGLIEDRNDVFWLTLAELARLAKPDTADREGLDLRRMVSSRKAEYGEEILRHQVPRVVTSTGETFYGPPAEASAEPEAAEATAERAVSDTALKGTPASSGVYEGVVRVILDPVGARLEPGEVLVAPGTDPAWTPLFLSAGALVVETGGAMSHGAVVAREYGIPAVVGVPDATRLLATGRRVKVDGESGTVTVISKRRLTED